MFNGDGCSASNSDPMRSPLRKTAIVEIICRPCVAEDPGEEPKLGLCHVAKLDGCTLGMRLAVNCPPLQRVAPLTLDVGSSKGAHDVVRMGTPAPCAANAGALDGVRQNPSSFFLTLAHGRLPLAPPQLRVSAGCEGVAEGALAHGGTLTAAAGSQEMRIHCWCVGAAPQQRLVRTNVTLAIRTRDYTPPAFRYEQLCPIVSRHPHELHGAARAALS